MTKTTLVSLGTALIALGYELQSEAEALPSEAPNTDAPPATTTTRRGRKPNTETQAPAEDKGKPESELRELCRPLIEDGKGQLVKDVLAKYGDAKRLSDLQPVHHAAFIKDIEALLI